MPRKELTKEQASSLVCEEYEHLQATYSSLLKSVTRSEDNLLEFTTLEGDHFIVKISSEGWKVVKGGQVSIRERTWEMVEDLLRSVSPLFGRGWDNMLVEKLQTLADTRGAEGVHETTDVEQQTGQPNDNIKHMC
jgi:hypothetical protein